LLHSTVPDGILKKYSTKIYRSGASRRGAADFKFFRCSSNFKSKTEVPCSKRNANSLCLSAFFAILANPMDYNYPMTKVEWQLQKPNPNPGRAIKSTLA
jgi:hypothetical protein